MNIPLLPPPFLLEAVVAKSGDLVADIGVRELYERNFRSGEAKVCGAEEAILFLVKLLCFFFVQSSIDW